VGITDDGTTIALGADQVAAEVAVAVKASKLVFLAGVPGFMAEDELLAQVSTSQLEALLSSGVLSANLARKAKNALSAIARGVERVHVIDARTPHSIIAEFFTDQGIGSLVTHG
jgi:acetylglutamate kinase